MLLSRQRSVVTSVPLTMSIETLVGLMRDMGLRLSLGGADDGDSSEGATDAEIEAVLALLGDARLEGLLDGGRDDPALDCQVRLHVGDVAD